MDAYHQQRVDWKREREEAKQKGETVTKQPFRHTPIIAIVFYHGKTPWKDFAFADQFDLPEDWLRDFIPDVKIFVIDMNQFTDSFIESIGASFLQPMLYLFKHKGDKEFLKHHSRKIFKFVEELKADELTKNFLKTIFFFMIQTFKLKKEEVGELVQELPPEYLKNSTMVQDIEKSWIDEVLEQGIGIGMEKGLEKGKQIKDLDNTIKNILLLSKIMPTYTDSSIAKILKLKESLVKRVRKVFQTKRPSTIKRFVRSVYKKVPAMKEADFLALEESTLLLWKEFQS